MLLELLQLEEVQEQSYSEKLRLFELIFRNFGNFIVTTVYDDKHIVKFFWNKDPDLTGVLEGKTLKLIGRVKSHELSKYTNCNETHG